MAPHVCFVGLQNLPLLAPEFGAPVVGGAELQQTMLAKALARRGFPISMVVADLGQRDGARWDGVTTYRAYQPNEGIRFLRFLHPRWTRLWAALRRANADVYYTSCGGHLVGQVAMFTRGYGRKLVFRVAADTDCDPRKLMVGSRLERWFYGYGLKRADVVLAQTETQERALLRNFARASRVTPQFVDLGAPRRGYGKRDIDVLWVSNLHRRKRAELLLETARSLPELHFHMIGGPVRHGAQYFESIRQSASALPNVTFHGFVPYHEVRKFYERAKLFAGTSAIEGFPNAYLQAWAHGVPVVAFLDPDGLIAQHGLGRAVDSSEVLRRALVELARNAESWAAASARCARYIDERYDEDRLVAPYIDALQEC